MVEINYIWHVVNTITNEENLEENSILSGKNTGWNKKNMKDP